MTRRSLLAAIAGLFIPASSPRALSTENIWRQIPIFVGHQLVGWKFIGSCNKGHVMEGIIREMKGRRIFQSYTCNAERTRIDFEIHIATVDYYFGPASKKSTKWQRCPVNLEIA